MKPLIFTSALLLVITTSSLNAAIVTDDAGGLTSRPLPINGCGNFTQRFNPSASDLPIGCGGCAKNGKFNISPTKCDLCKGFEHVYLLTHDRWGNQIGELNEQGVLVLDR